jgi:hypothetical protein
VQAAHELAAEHSRRVGELLQRAAAEDPEMRAADGTCGWFPWAQEHFGFDGLTTQKYLDAAPVADNGMPF